MARVSSKSSGGHPGFNLPLDSKGCPAPLLPRVLFQSLWMSGRRRMPRSLIFSSAVSSCSCLSPHIGAKPNKGPFFLLVRLSPNKSLMARKQEPKVFSTQTNFFYKGIAFENLFEPTERPPFQSDRSFSACIHSVNCSAKIP